MRLNRRLAPDVYLGLAPIEVRGKRFEIGALGEKCVPAREHVVVMRRLPVGRDALSLLAAHDFGVDRVDAVAKRLARFHAANGLGRPSPWSRAEWLAHLQKPVVDNLGLLEAAAGRLFRALRLGRDARGRARVRRVAPRRSSRRAAAKGVQWMATATCTSSTCGSRPVATSRRWSTASSSTTPLRRIDVAAEVAFLAMDLRYRRQARLATRFLQSYAEAADDYGLFEVVDYFVSYRAAVRAKVAAIAADDARIAAPQRAAAAKERAFSHAPRRSCAGPTGVRRGGPRRRHRGNREEHRRGTRSGPRRVAS